MIRYAFNKELIVKNENFEFFFGTWGVESSLPIDESFLELFPKLSFYQDTNIFLLSSTFSSSAGSQSLFSINSAENRNLDALLFRGYLLEPPIHSLSDKQRIIKYWEEGTRQHNGVFATVLFKNKGNTLEMVTDAFGIGSLYYRKLGTGIAFATSPRFLSCEGDKQDLVAWRCLMQSGFVPGNRSLSDEVKRVPPGTVLSFHEGQERACRWFDYASLPTGENLITPAAVDEVESAFTLAMQRCLNLKTDERLLPLSSGYDSRHILAHMLENDITFDSATVRVPDEQNRDIDGYFSAQLAKDLGFSHAIFEMPTGQALIAAEETRRFCLDYESRMHAWFLPIWNQPIRSTLVLEGLCGDTLGHSGLKMSGIGLNYKAEHGWITDRLMKPSFDSVLNQKIWPQNKEVIAMFKEVIEPLPETPNLIDLVMILHRARRAISISSQQFSKPGHVVVYPYLDLEYVKLLLSYAPEKRFNESLQGQCLKKYHRQIFDYPGSHSFLINVVMPYTDQNNEEISSIKDKINNDVCRYLRLKRKIKYTLLSTICKKYDDSWWITCMVDFVKRERKDPFIYKR